MNQSQNQSQKHKHKHKHKKRRFDDDEIRSKMELLAELQIHQVELEMQNRELRATQQQLEITRDRYADLYDYAPVGYLTLNKVGCILAINMTGAAMLGVARASIVGRSLATSIAQHDNRALSRYLEQTFISSGNTVAELRIMNPSSKTKYVRLESSIVKGSATCRTVMTDIDQLKETTSLNHELLLENRRLMQNMFKIQEEERRVLARELHDELGQWLTAIYAEAETICNRADKESVIYTSALAISDCVSKMHTVIHSMLHHLRPPLLDTLGLVDALQELKKQWCSHHSHILLESRLEGELDNLDEHINITVFRIVQEALNNVRSHARATQAQVQLCREKSSTSVDDVLLLSIEDNGKGYHSDQESKGLGLLGMRERAIAVNGAFTVHSVPNGGTQIQVRLPLSHHLNKKENTYDDR